MNKLVEFISFTGIKHLFKYLVVPLKIQYPDFVLALIIKVCAVPRVEENWATGRVSYYRTLVTLGSLVSRGHTDNVTVSGTLGFLVTLDSVVLLEVLWVPVLHKYEGFHISN